MSKQTIEVTAEHIAEAWRLMWFSGTDDHLTFSQCCPVALAATEAFGRPCEVVRKLAPAPSDPLAWTYEYDLLVNPQSANALVFALPEAGVDVALCWDDGVPVRPATFTVELSGEAS